MLSDVLILLFSFSQWTRLATEFALNNFRIIAVLRFAAISNSLGDGTSSETLSLAGLSYQHCFSMITVSPLQPNKLYWVELLTQRHTSLAVIETAMSLTRHVDYP